jgi:hypothetical protein
MELTTSELLSSHNLEHYPLPLSLHDEAHPLEIENVLTRPTIMS